MHVSSLPACGWIIFFFFILRFMYAVRLNIQPRQIKELKMIRDHARGNPFCVGHRRFVPRQTVAMPTDGADAPQAPT